MDETKHFAREAYLAANRNEQYSRKINGVPQNDRENVIEFAQNVIESECDVEFQDKDKIAVHRIPGEAGEPTPI